MAKKRPRLPASWRIPASQRKYARKGYQAYLQFLREGVKKRNQGMRK